MKILIFSDLHYFGGTEKVFNAKKKLVEYAEPMLKEISRIATYEKVDFVVNLGDIIQDTNDRSRDLSCLTLMYNKLKEFSCPVYSVLGNHDLKMMNSVDDVEGLIGQNLANFSMNLNNFHFVFLSPELRCELGTERGGSYKAQYIGNNTLEWLKNDLAENVLPTIVFTHFPVSEDQSIKDECMFMKDRKELKDILLASGRVKHVFTGHQHTPKVILEDGISYYIVGLPTASLLEDGVPIGVFRMLEINGNDIDITEHYIRI